MKGLIIKPYWADLILSGQKTWEIRGSRTHQRGRIGIIKSGSGEVCGSVDLVDCIPIHDNDDPDMLIANQDKHHVPFGAIPYRKPWAWVLENPTVYTDPVPYKHPLGAVIWVNLE
ncbi:ASCH domain-containing protein [Paenibacillus aurantiacus]|uniref:ASCH domain-containing protein n=1 Tax=Paenibacillus aurantiacus TaxID=1936118 RepID=A0ABV5KXU4_9BACL